MSCNSNCYSSIDISTSFLFMVNMHNLNPKLVMIEIALELQQNIFSTESTINLFFKSCHISSISANFFNSNEFAGYLSR